MASFGTTPGLRIIAKDEEEIEIDTGLATSNSPYLKTYVEDIKKERNGWFTKDTGEDYTVFAQEISIHQ